MTPYKCPACTTPNPIAQGDFYFCEHCGLMWWAESEELDVTEAKPE